MNVLVWQMYGICKVYPARCVGDYNDILGKLAALATEFEILDWPAIADPLKQANEKYEILTRRDHIGNEAMKQYNKDWAIFKRAVQSVAEGIGIGTHESLELFQFTEMEIEDDN